MTALLAQAGSSREWYDGWQLTALMAIAFALYATLLALGYKRMSKVNQTENRAVLEDYKIRQGKAAETENQVSSVFAGATRADWVAKSET